MNHTLRLMSLMSGFALFGGAMLGPIYALFVSEIGGGIILASQTIAVFAIITGIILYLTTKWEDHQEHQEKFLVLGYILFVIGYLSLILVQNEVQLFAVQIIFAFGAGLIIPAFDGIFSDHLDKGKALSEWGGWETMKHIVIGLGALAGGYIASNYGFGFLFMIMAMFSFFAFLTSLKFYLDTSKQ